MTIRRRFILPVLVIVVLVVAAGIYLLTRPGEPLFPYKGPDECLDRVIDDANGNGQLDPGESDINPPGLQIQISDPNGSFSGTYSYYDCHFEGTANPRQIHLHIIVPQGYTATSPLDIDVGVDGGQGFADNPPPPQILLLHPNGTPTAAP